MLNLHAASRCFFMGYIFASFFYPDLGTTANSNNNNKRERTKVSNKRVKKAKSKNIRGRYIHIHRTLYKLQTKREKQPRFFKITHLPIIVAGLNLLVLVIYLFDRDLLLVGTYHSPGLSSQWKMGNIFPYKPSRPHMKS